MTRSSLAGFGLLALLLGIVTSCVAPDPREVAKAPPKMTDAHELVRRLAPALAETDVAALPERAGTTAPVGAPYTPPPFLEQAASDADAARARGCLTAAVYYEARSEPVEGQRAVAQVVLNRVRDRAFPHSVCGVVYQGVGSGKGCQFSFACDGSTLRPRDPVSWAAAERVAVAALNGGVMAAVGNATFYHAGYVLPWWASSLTRLGQIGHHIFYRWPGALERALGMRAQYAGVEPGVPASGNSGGGVAVATAGTAFGVTVHRGVAASVEAGVSLESDAPAALRPASYAGVRVHRGEDAPVVAEEVKVASGA